MAMDRLDFKNGPPLFCALPRSPLAPLHLVT
jgi:hypothetical protein